MTDQIDISKEQRTSGEALFEEYLRQAGYEFQFEPEVPGKRKKPDYLVTAGSARLFCEVKQFTRDDLTTRGFGAYDPYPRIREKISQARKKFKEFKNELPCCLVIYSGHAFVDVENPSIIMGSMYGDFGITLPLSISTGTAAGEPAETFLGRGKMIQPGSSEPRNTTISAIITIRHVAVGRTRIENWLKAHPLGPEDILDWTNERIGFDVNERGVGVMIWENAFAAKPLPRDLFNGRYDVRWGADAARQKIVFSGPGLPLGEKKV